MKFLFDENIGWTVVEFFTKQNYDIKSVLEDLRGYKDKEILEIAYKDERIVVTLDKDFCGLIFRDHIPCEGVILLRLSNESQKNIISVLRDVLENIYNEFSGNFVVVNDKNIRIRKI